MQCEGGREGGQVYQGNTAKVYGLPLHSGKDDLKLEESCFLFTSCLILTGITNLNFWVFVVLLIPPSCPVSWTTHPHRVFVWLLALATARTCSYWSLILPF